MNVAVLNGYSVSVKTENNEIKTMAEQKKPQTPPDILAIRMLEKTTQNEAYNSYASVEKQQYIIRSVANWQEKTKSLLSEFSSNALEKAIFALSKTHIRPQDDWLQAWEAQTLSVMPQFETPKLIKSLHSLAHMGIYPSESWLNETLDTLEVRLNEEGADVGDVPISKALQSLAIFRAIDPSFHHTVVDTVFEKLENRGNPERRVKLRYHEAATVFNRPQNLRPYWDNVNALIGDRLERDEATSRVEDLDVQKVKAIIEGVNGVVSVTPKSYSRTLLEPADFRVILKAPIAEQDARFKNRPNQVILMQVDDAYNYTLLPAQQGGNDRYQYNGVTILQNAVAEESLGKNEQLARVPARNQSDIGNLATALPESLQRALSKPSQKTFLNRSAIVKTRTGGAHVGSASVARDGADNSLNSASYDGVVSQSLSLAI